MPDFAHLLNKLRQRGPDSPAAGLVRLAVDHALDKPVGETLAAPELAAAVRAAAAGWDEAALRQGAAAEYQRGLQAWEALGGATRDHLPAAVPAALDKQLRKPIRLEAPLVMALIDQPAVRALIRDVLQVTLVSFLRKASTPLTEHRLFTGVMSRASSLAKGASGVFAASGVLSAVSAGLEQEMDRKVREFLDEAMSSILQRAVAHICDPAHGDSYAALAAGVVDSALALPPAQWGAQIRHAEPAGRGVEVALAWRAWAQTPEFQAWLTRLLEVALAGRQDLTVRGWLDGMGLAEAAADAAAGLLRPAVEEVLAGEPFEGWLAALLDEDRPAARKPARRRKG